MTYEMLYDLLPTHNLTFEFEVSDTRALCHRVGCLLYMRGVATSDVEGRGWNDILIYDFCLRQLHALSRLMVRLELPN